MTHAIRKANVAFIKLRSAVIAISQERNQCSLKEAEKIEWKYLDDETTSEFDQVFDETQQFLNIN